MSQPPRVSVVIPAYNAANTLDETLASVAGQTFRDYEVVVVDDGSSDATPEILTRHAAGWPQLRWVRQDNAGVSVARNHAVELARGDFIAFLDADDLWLPEKLALQMSLFDGNPALAVAYCDMIDFLPDCDATTTLFQEKKPARGNVLRQLFMGNFVPTPTVVMRKAAFVALGGFNPLHRLNEDVDLFLRVAEQYQFDYVPEVLVRRRILSTSLMHANSLGCQRRDLEIFDYWTTRRPDLFPDNAPHVRQRRAIVFARMGRTLLEQGDFSGARSAYRHAIRLGLHGPDLLLRTMAAHLPPLAAAIQRMKRARHHGRS